MTKGRLKFILRRVGDKVEQLSTVRVDGNTIILDTIGGFTGTMMDQLVELNKANEARLVAFRSGLCDEVELLDAEDE